MTNVGAEPIHRGLLGALALARHAGSLGEWCVLKRTSWTLPVGGETSGCRRVRTALSVDGWRERLDGNQSEGLMDEGKPNKALERTAAERLGFDMAGFMNIIRHGLSAFPAAVAQLGRSTK